MADTVARRKQGMVGFVFEPWLAQRLQIRLNLRPFHRQEGSDATPGTARTGFPTLWASRFFPLLDRMNAAESLRPGACAVFSSIPFPPGHPACER